MTMMMMVVLLTRAAATTMMMMMIATVSAAQSGASCPGSGLYLRRSRIPHAGWGVFAGQNYRAGDTIGMPGRGIPVWDLPLDMSSSTTTSTSKTTTPTTINTEDDTASKKTKKDAGRFLQDDNDNGLGMLSEFLWEAANLGGFQEANHSSLRTNNNNTTSSNSRNGGNVQWFLPGPVSLVNHHPTLANVILGGLELQPLLESNTNDYHYGQPRPLIATMDIHAGDELFLDYWALAAVARHPAIVSRVMSVFPYEALHFDRADALVQSLASRLLSLSLERDEKNEDQGLTEAQWMDILRRLATELILPLPSSSTNDNNSILQRRVADLLPRTRTELEEAARVGVAEWHLRLSGLYSSNVADADRSFCLDTVAVNAPDEAATATQFVAAGHVITAAPLVYVANGTAAMTIANHNAQHNNNATRQVLANYCFGHRHHAALLCPATHAAFMGHGSNTKGSSCSRGDKAAANVQVQWLSSSSTTTAVLLASTLAQGVDVNRSDVTTMNTWHGGLVLEYVAICDIHPGDALLVDFGDEYEEALQSYRQKQQQGTKKKTRLSAVQLNNQKQRPVPSQDPFVQHNQYAYECEVYPNMKIQDGSAFSDWEHWQTNRMVHRLNWPSDFVARYGTNDFAAWYPCQIVEVVDNIDNDSVYNVEILTKDSIRSKTKSEGRMVTRRLRDFPRDRIRWVEGPYQSAWHAPDAFRHSPVLPDTIFPLYWRDDYRPATSWNLGAIASSDADADYEASLRQAKCGLYLAPSNIPGAGFGVYTAVDIPAENVIVGSSVPAVIRQGKEIDGFLWQGKDYTWTGTSFGIHYDGYPEYDVDVMQGLSGGMSNFHTGLVNVELNSALSTPLLDRRTSPGAGALTDYANSSFPSLYPIEAGEELFISYGENWLKYRESFRDVPLEEDYKAADLISASIWSLLNLEGASIPERFVPGLVETVQQYGLENRRTKMALNSLNDMDKLNLVVERNGTARSTVTKRSQEWFEEHGYCQDHIYLARSTIPHAGNGAFARRIIPKGSLVIASPLITAPRQIMEMNYTKQGKHPINTKQLMMNYHFGHQDSTILFFPLTHAIAINHNSRRSKINGSLRAEPNARVELSTHHPKSRYLLQRPLSDIFAEKYSSLFLNIVALRDIEVGEEVFIDYGEAWEEAWQEHLSRWKTPCGKTQTADCTKSGFFVEYMMNSDPHNPRYHTWTDYHLTSCRVRHEILWDNHTEMIFLTEKTPLDVDLAIDPQVRQEYRGYTYDDEGFWYPFLSLQSNQPCQILNSDSASNTFDVVYFLQSWQIPQDRRKAGLEYGSGNIDPGHSDHHQHRYDPVAMARKASPTRALVFVESLDRKYLKFLNKPLTADGHDPQAFRHEIHIPDEAFPELWKDLKKR